MTPEKSDAWKRICDMADKVVGQAPQIIACPSCGQENRVSWARTIKDDARCGKCGAIVAPRRK